jgi:uncharacterized protein DUF5946
MRQDQDAYDELSCYTLAHGDPAFIHQHVVDAFTVQTADAATKPIALTFGLAGLYLAVERQFTGRQVQRAHMAMGRKKHTWPAFVLPAARGPLTVRDVLAVPPGPDRDEAIHAWSASVWDAFRDNRSTVAALLVTHGIVDAASVPARTRRR